MPHRAGLVSYEVGMLHSLPALRAHFENQGDSTAANACLEAWVVHARALIEFLGGRKPSRCRRGCDPETNVEIGGRTTRTLRRVPVYLDVERVSETQHVRQASRPRIRGTELVAMESEETPPERVQGGNDPEEPR